MATLKRSRVPCVGYGRRRALLACGGDPEPSSAHLDLEKSAAALMETIKLGRVSEAAGSIDDAPLGPLLDDRIAVFEPVHVVEGRGIEQKTAIEPDESPFIAELNGKRPVATRPLQQPFEQVWRRLLSIGVGDLRHAVDLDHAEVRTRYKDAAVARMRHDIAGAIETDNAAIDTNGDDIANGPEFDLVEEASANQIAIAIDDALTAVDVGILPHQAPAVRPTGQHPWLEWDHKVSIGVDGAGLHYAVELLPDNGAIIAQWRPVVVLRFDEPRAVAREEPEWPPVWGSGSGPDEAAPSAVKHVDLCQVRSANRVSFGVVEADVLAMQQQAFHQPRQSFHPLVIAGAPSAFGCEDDVLGEWDGALKHRLDDDLAGAIDDASLVANEDFGQPLMEITREVELRRDDDLAALIDIAEASVEADRRQPFAERHRAFEARGDHLFLGATDDVAAEAEFAVTLRNKVRRRGLRQRRRAP